MHIGLLACLAAVRAVLPSWFWQTWAMNLWLGYVFLFAFAANTEILLLVFVVLTRLLAGRHSFTFGWFFHNPELATDPRVGVKKKEMPFACGVPCLFMCPFPTACQDFWSKRWNVAFRDLSHRTIYLPLKRRINKFACAMLVFSLSALIHEFNNFVALPGSEYGQVAGDMILYFGLHGLCAVAYGLLWRIGGQPKNGFMPWLPAWLLFTTWIVVLSPLWFRSWLKVFPLHGDWVEFAQSLSNF